MIKVLDKGFVELVDFMGGDLAVVQAARVSYNEGSKGEEKDRKLINYLMKHHHETPFEMSVFKFHVKAPLFVARQWFRHRIGSYNEISYRYVEVIDSEFYLPDQFRQQDSKNKQASVDNVPEPINEILRDSLIQHYVLSHRLYRNLLDQGVSREMSRIVLPVSLYTEFYVTYNARSLMNFIRLRDEKGAQFEIQQYAKALDQYFEEKMPWSYAAFKESLSA